MQYPVRWTAQSALHFTPWHTCPFRHQRDVSGKHSSHDTAITSIDYPLTFPRLPGTHLYSRVINASWRERKCQNFDMVAKGIQTPGSLDCESGVLPLSYRVSTPISSKSTMSEERNRVYLRHDAKLFSQTHLSATITCKDTFMTI